MAFEWDANMIAEKVALEMRVLALSQEAAHTDEAIRVGQQLLSVRKKISLLSVNMIDPLKIEFQQRLQLEAARAQGVYFFPEGSLDFKIAEMPQTVAQMVEPFVPPRHLRLNDLFNTYFAQPWLAEMAVTDVRLEEELLVLSLDERKLEADLSSLRTIISDGRESLKNYDMKEEDLNIEIEERELLNKEPINDYEFEHEENKLRIFHAMKAVSNYQSCQQLCCGQS